MRIRKFCKYTGGFSIGDVVRFAGAARLGKVRIGGPFTHIWMRHVEFFNFYIRDEGMQDSDLSSAKVQAGCIGLSGIHYFM